MMPQRTVSAFAIQFSSSVTGSPEENAKSRKSENAKFRWDLTRRHEDAKIDRKGNADRRFDSEALVGVPDSPEALVGHFPYISLRVFVSSCSMSFRVFALSRFRVL